MDNMETKKYGYWFIVPCAGRKDLLGCETMYEETLANEKLYEDELILSDIVNTLSDSLRAVKQGIGIISDTKTCSEWLEEQGKFSPYAELRCTSSLQPVYDGRRTIKIRLELIEPENVDYDDTSEA